MRRPEVLAQYGIPQYQLAEEPTANKTAPNFILFSLNTTYRVKHDGVIFSAFRVDFPDSALKVLLVSDERIPQNVSRRLLTVDLLASTNIPLVDWKDVTAEKVSDVESVRPLIAARIVKALDGVAAELASPDTFMVLNEKQLTAALKICESVPAQPGADVTAAVASVREANRH